jgi:hypothetical protein
MNVNVLINLVADDNFTMNPDEAAKAVMEALKGNPLNDMVTVSVSGSGQHGSFAPAPAPPPPAPMMAPPAADE